MIGSRLGTAILSFAVLLCSAGANAQVRNFDNDLPSIFSELQRMQTFAGGPLVFEDADTAVLGSLKVQLFGVRAPNIDERCSSETENNVTCGLLALAVTLDLVDGIDPLDCLIVGAGEDNVLHANCLSDEFEDVPFDKNTNDLGEILVLRGVARVDERFDSPDMGRFRVAELEAQKAREGFWDCDEPAPRSWASEKDKLCN